MTLNDYVPMGITIVWAIVVSWVIAADFRRRKQLRGQIKTVEGVEDYAKRVKEASSKYGKDELRRDLLDPNLTLEQVMERCKGMNPEDIEEVAKSLGKDRKAERLAWFALMQKTAKMLKVVPPPLGPATVVTLSGQSVKCPYCDGTGLYGHGSARLWTSPPRGSGPLVPRPPNGSKCDSCKGNGLVIISGS